MSPSFGYWVLILMLFGDGARPPLETIHIEGFSSERACAEAGYRASVTTQDKTPFYGRYLCVEKR